MAKIVDDISVYRHIQFPKEIIENPRYIIKIKNLSTKGIHFFGGMTLPKEKELKEFFLPNALWEVEHYNPLEFDIANYTYQVLFVK